jgi:hypothetical protein
MSLRKDTVIVLELIRDKRIANELSVEEAQFQAKMELLSFVDEYFPDVAEAYYEADDCFS